LATPPPTPAATAAPAIGAAGTTPDDPASGPGGLPLTGGPAPSASAGNWLAIAALLFGAILAVAGAGIYRSRL